MMRCSSRRETHGTNTVSSSEMLAVVIMQEATKSVNARSRKGHLRWISLRQRKRFLLRGKTVDRISQSLTMTILSLIHQHRQISTSDE